nr:UvrD-like helicase, ATP-binding domain, P-loop containing nucleoside triphosphate hydrolase [Tanacetum cinerariifolium]
MEQQRRWRLHFCSIFKSRGLDSATTECERVRLVIVRSLTSPSKEDHVHRISKSVFVTNFPDNFGSRNLWDLCEAYGKVVDVFIPNRTGSPALVLDDLCVNNVDLSRRVMGRVKELNSIPNLRNILMKEGFLEVQLYYLGGLWVMMEVKSKKIKRKMLQHTVVKSWFHDLLAATHDLVINERIVWVDVEGIPLNLWSSASFSKIEDDSFLGNVNNLDTTQHDKANSTGERDDEGVSDTIFGDNL